MPRPPGTLIRDELFTFNTALPANVPGTVCQVNPPVGTKAVLRRLWTFLPAANATALTVNIYREQALFFSVYPHCLPNYNVLVLATELWIPALEELKVLVTSTTGHIATDVGVIAQVETRDLTLADKMSWGLVRDRRITSDYERGLIDDLNLWDLYDAGIFTLPVALAHEHRGGPTSPRGSRTLRAREQEQEHRR